MQKILKFSQFDTAFINEATTSKHSLDRLEERTNPKNMEFLNVNFLKEFPNNQNLELQIKEHLRDTVLENSYDVIGKTYSYKESVLVLLCAPKIKFKNVDKNLLVKVTSLDKKGNSKTYTGNYWAVVYDNKIITVYLKEDANDQDLIDDMREHMKREEAETYAEVTKFSIDRKTVKKANLLIEINDDGTIKQEISQYISIDKKEFQTVIKPGLELTYFGMNVDKTLVPKKAVIESIVKANGQPINFNNEFDVSQGVKIFFTNKGSKTFIPNKDCIMIDGKKAEIIRIFLDKRMQNPINFLLRVTNSVSKEILV